MVNSKSNISVLENYKFEHTPSKYHMDIYKEGLTTNNSLAIQACAGGSKTTTIINLANLLKISNPNIKILFLAFNKAIVEELQERLPKNVEVRTTHSLGMKIICSDRKRKVDGSKMRSIIKQFLPTWNLQYDMEEADIKEYCQRVEKLCQLGRLFLCKKKEDLVTIAGKYGIDIFNGELDKVAQVMTHANTNVDTIDFADMIYQPVRKKAKYIDKIEKYDVVISDEAQDYNKCQLELAQMCVNDTGRMIFVFDKKQAIYAFAGADSDSTKRITDLTINGEKIKQLPLSVCYRCGSDIIDYVKKAVKGLNIEPFEKNGTGKVDEKASMLNIKGGDMVLCRLNAPLIKAFYFFIKRKKSAYIKGRDMGKQIVNYINRSKRKTLEGLQNWMEKDLDKLYKKIQKTYPQFDREDVLEHNSYVYLKERIEIINDVIAYAVHVTTIANLIKEFYTIFKESGNGICLSSIHRSKGLESDNVFIIRKDKMPYVRKNQMDWELEQEDNLIYVAYTRAKKYLGFVADWDEHNEFTGKE